MQRHLRFLAISSVVMKIAAWIFLFLGILAGVAIVGIRMLGTRPLAGIFILAIYCFFSFLCYVIAKAMDVLAEIIKELRAQKV